MRRLRGAVAPRLPVVIGLFVILAAGCATSRIVPVPAAGIRIDPTQGIASVSGEGVELTVQPSAWKGSPWDLRNYVTPFLVGISNDTAAAVDFDFESFRLFDDSRFQYTALPPIEVERILRWRAQGEVRLAAMGSRPPVVRRPVVPVAPGWWGPYGWWGWPWYYPGFPPPSDIYLRALPMGALQASARLEGFVYFPLLRGDAHAFTLEFHHRVGAVPRVLTLPFQIERPS